MTRLKGGAPAPHRDARGTTYLHQRSQNNATDASSVGIVAIENGIDPHVLPGPLRTADLRQFALDDLDRISAWEGLNGVPVAIVVANATHVEANEIAIRLVRAGADPTGIHRFGSRA